MVIIWKMTFTVVGFALLGFDAFVTSIEVPLEDLGVGTPYINIAHAFIGHTYDTIAAIGLAILGISSLPPRKKEEPVS